MSGVQPSLFFVSLPDLKSLCCVTLKLQDDYEEPRTKQITTCRELVLLFSDVLAAPALDSFTEITAVMAIQFFRSGLLQGFVQRHCLQMIRVEPVFPGTLQVCVSFSLVSRLAPNWNKAGLYLINGRDFLLETGRLTAVSLELSSSEGKLCMSVQPSAIRLLPTTLEDFGLSPVVLRRFCSDPDSVLDPYQTGGPVWCHVLPSLKKGQIITISRKLPTDGPFKSYRELQIHWDRLYGYRLPDQEEEQLVYCSVYFKLVGPNLFTYPLCCIRLSPVQRCPRVDQQGALSCFMDDVTQTFPAVCGFPTKISTKSTFTTTTLNPASRLTSSPLNLSDLSCSRSVLSHLPPPPRPGPPPPGPPLGPGPPPPGPPLGPGPGPSSLSRSVKLFFGCQPAPAPPLSFSSGFFSSQRSSSSLAPDFSDVFKPSSSINTFFTVFEASSSFPPPPPPPPPPPFLLEKAKFVPIFRSKPPSQLVNVALLKAKKQNVERLTLPPALNSHRSTHAPAVPPAVPSRVPTGAQTSLNVKRIPTFSPKTRMRPALIVIPDEKEERPEKKSKPVVTFNLEQTEKTESKSKSKSSRKGPEALKTKSVLKTSTEERPTKNLQREEKTKPARAARDVDVEKMARNNQLSRVSSVKMLQWLRARGLNVQKLPKDQLMLKVMGCLAEI
ncbi:uncharacterized protein LOC110163973 [Boleophthalmus pectinirostris]|uniref:uncharacterized protein LOC110163973 n=1 Tax=Boleophthalmus pectinirostris TaxID=150288 RepID=UPI002430BEEA|nr:uncharacterized protein LOC110163973 [Boleophthalmus pectinirostris]